METLIYPRLPVDLWVTKQNFRLLGAWCQTLNSPCCRVRSQGSHIVGTLENLEVANAGIHPKFIFPIHVTMIQLGHGCAASCHTWNSAYIEMSCVTHIHSIMECERNWPCHFRANIFKRQACLLHVLFSPPSSWTHKGTNSEEDWTWRWKESRSLHHHLEVGSWRSALPQDTSVSRK